MSLDFLDRQTSSDKWHWRKLWYIANNQLHRANRLEHQCVVRSWWDGTGLAVVHMATVFQKGIIAATLLTHVVQQEVSRPIVHMIIDGKTR